MFGDIHDVGKFVELLVDEELRRDPDPDPPEQRPQTPFGGVQPLAGRVIAERCLPFTRLFERDWVNTAERRLKALLVDLLRLRNSPR